MLNLQAFMLFRLRAKSRHQNALLSPFTPVFDPSGGKNGGKNSALSTTDWLKRLNTNPGQGSTSGGTKV